MLSRNYGKPVSLVILVAITTCLLAACAKVESPVVPTLTSDLSQTPTAVSTAQGTNSQPQLASASLPVDSQGFADPAFRALWQRDDGDVASGKAARAWFWGQPVPFGAVDEPYAESPGGKRLVQYFEKGRMEINDPNADASQEWYVTSGLLTVELVTGRMQVGENAFDARDPARIPVSGDLDSPLADTPLYADYTSQRLAAAPNRAGQQITTQFVHGQPDREITPPARVLASSYDDSLGHNIADVFTSYFDQDLATMGLNWLFVMGHPISEPYWVNASFGGSNHMVLVQLFERRALSFDPSSPAGQQVQFTNIGLHYYRWRYHDQTGLMPGGAVAASSMLPDISAVDPRSWRQRI